MTATNVDMIASVINPYFEWVYRNCLNADADQDGFSDSTEWGINLGNVEGSHTLQISMLAQAVSCNYGCTAVPGATYIGPEFQILAQ